MCAQSGCKKKTTARGFFSPSRDVDNERGPRECSAPKTLRHRQRKSRTLDGKGLLEVMLAPNMVGPERWNDCSESEPIPVKNVKSQVEWPENCTNMAERSF